MPSGRYSTRDEEKVLDNFSFVWLLTCCLYLWITDEYVTYR